jgi:hypothetical protein
MKTTLLAMLAMFCITFVASAADVTGKWAAEIPGRGGNTNTTTFTFQVSGGAVSGTVNGGRGDTMIADGKLDGDTLTFTTTAAGRDGTPVKTTYTGKVSADHIDFTRDNGRGPIMFTAKKQ